MAELNVPIIAKASAVTGEVPQASDLEVAELSVNTADAKLFTKHTDGSVKEISGSGGGGSVDSVNGETGVVSLGIQDMDDFELAPGVVPGGYWAVRTTSNPNPGEWFLNGSTLVRVDPVDSNGVDWTTEMAALTSASTFWYSLDGSNWTSKVNSTFLNNLPDWYQFDLSPENLNSPSHTGPVYIAFTDPADTPGLPLADGDILQWVDAEEKFKPIQLPGRGAVTSWSVTANGTSDYIFAGDGFAGTETDPILYVVRGQTYEITNSMGAHPFQVQSTAGAGGTAYSDGITNNAVSNGTLTWEVRLDAPAKLYYQCTAHGNMGGTIQVLENVDPSASNLRSLLGFGEYVDDTAAGAAGLVSGAIYFNTTSNDYRAKA